MATDIPRDLLDELGLRAEQLELVADERPPDDRRGHGLAREPAAAADVDALPLFSAPLSADIEAVIPMRRWDVDAAVVALGAPMDSVTFIRGEPRVTANGFVLLDGRAGGCAAHVDTAGGEFVVVNDDGRIRVLRIVSHAGLEERLRDVVVVAAHIDVPAIDELLVDAGAADWLRGAAEELASSSRRFDRVAACGLVARAWGPVDGAARRAFATGEMTSPRDRAEEWRARLSADARSELAREVLLAADDWQSMFTLTLDRARAGEHDAASIILALHARDDLESVAWCIAPTRLYSVVRARLDDLDRLAMTRRSEFYAFRDVLARDARLEAIGWIASEVWWGQLA